MPSTLHFRSTLGMLFVFSAGLALGQRNTAPTQNAAEPRLRSHVFVYSLADKSSREVFTDDAVWEAPNWSPDGKYLLMNHAGNLYRLVLGAVQPASPQKLTLPAGTLCNNDKSLSPDGKLLAFSASMPSSPGSEVYVAHADGTEVRQVTFESPSYFHGWSPDGKTLAFVAQRRGSDQFDIYSIPATGGTETQLTADTQHDDGPDYSPDGKWIYINSARSGKEAVWRFLATSHGIADKQASLVVNDTEEDWFPHLAPDGRKLVYITYPAGTPTHNSRELNVTLRMVSIEGVSIGKMPSTLVTLRGGQGTINVNSWSPDSEHFAYVSYERLP